MTDTQKKEDPILQYAILCDAVAKDQFGKSVYIGIFDRISNPTVFPQFIVALKWICGLGSHQVKLRILSPELTPLKTSDNFPMQFNAKTDVFAFDFPIINFNFNEVGVYWIEVMLNDITYISVPLPVHSLQS